MAASDEAQAYRQALVARLKERGELDDPRLEAAFLSVPRHDFLPDLALDQAYSDEALPVKRDEYGAVVSSSSQPTMMAMMLGQLRLETGHNVLEIGAGTGYNAAIMKRIVGAEGHVTTLELDKEQARQAGLALQRIGSEGIRVVQADGAGGYAPRAAYDRIIATAGVWDVPHAWIDQLKPRGILVSPIWLNAMQVSAAFTRDGRAITSENNLPCGFIQLRGASEGPKMTRRVGTTPLLLTSNEIATLDMAALNALLSDDAETTFFDVRLEAGDYYQGFLPYFILNLPDLFTFAAYTISTNEQAYGIEGQGFALIGQGSACFVAFHAHGQALIFGAPDAFMALGEVLNNWRAAGKPGAQALRLRLTPIESGPPEIKSGIISQRQEHYLHLWQAT